METTITQTPVEELVERLNLIRHPAVAEANAQRAAARKKADEAATIAEQEAARARSLGDEAARLAVLADLEESRPEAADAARRQADEAEARARVAREEARRRSGGDEAGKRLVAEAATAAAREAMEELAPEIRARVQEMVYHMQEAGRLSEELRRIYAAVETANFHLRRIGGEQVTPPHGPVTFREFAHPQGRLAQWLARVRSFGYDVVETDWEGRHAA